MPSKPIAVGAGSLGWVDLVHGILLLCNLFGDGHPVIRYIMFPVPSVAFSGEDGHCCASEYFRDVAGCDDLIKFVGIRHDDDDFSTGGTGWKATVWIRNISWNVWPERSIVDVDDILVEKSYSDILPELRDDQTQELQLKKLIIYAPILSMHDDDLLCMMANVNDDEDGKAWVVAIDMRAEASCCRSICSVFCRMAVPPPYNVPRMRPPQVPQHDPRGSHG
jgi:hypothetical protein